MLHLYKYVINNFAKLFTLSLCVTFINVKLYVVFIYVISNS